MYSGTSNTVTTEFNANETIKLQIKCNLPNPTSV